MANQHALATVGKPMFCRVAADAVGSLAALCGIEDAEHKSIAPGHTPGHAMLAFTPPRNMPAHLRVAGNRQSARPKGAARVAMRLHEPNGRRGMHAGRLPACASGRGLRRKVALGVLSFALHDPARKAVFR